MTDPNDSRALYPACWLLLCAGALTLLLGCNKTNPNHSSVDAVTVKHELQTNTQPQAAPKSGPIYYGTSRLDGSIVIGLDADMSSGSARSGEAIRRGLELAIAKINDQGGLLGKPVELIVRDHRGNPDRGLGNLAAFSKEENLLGVFGGIHTPVAIRELEYIHQNKMLYFCPWAAGTPVVSNGYSPNHVFRVSVRDEYAGGFLVQKAVQRGAKKIGLLLERTAWGRSNESAITTALQTNGLEPVGIEWFNWGDSDFIPHIKRLRAAGCDTVLFVGNPLEGVTMTKSVSSLAVDERPAVVSHWGITGGEFYQLAAEHVSKIDLAFLQTFSFVQPRYPDRVKELEQAYLQRYPECSSARDIFSPVGTAHAYELMLMVAKAVGEAKSIEHGDVLAALEGIRDYRGIIRDYSHPFSADHHDALDGSDFILARYDDQGAIVPVDGE